MFLFIFLLSVVNENHRPHDTREKNKCVKHRIINENCYFLANRQLTLIFLCGNENFYRRERDIQDYPDSHAGHTKHDHFYLSFLQI